MTLKITMLGGNCPVQGEGTIDGVEFYFRARGQALKTLKGRKRDSSWSIWRINDVKGREAVVEVFQKALEREKV